jgi:hypothetical protein
MFSEELICIVVLLYEDKRKLWKMRLVYSSLLQDREKGNALLSVKSMWKILSGFVCILGCQNLFLTLSLIEDVQKNPTGCEAISPREKLAVCLK